MKAFCQGIRPLVGLVKTGADLQHLCVDSLFCDDLSVNRSPKTVGGKREVYLSSGTYTY